MTTILRSWLRLALLFLVLVGLPFAVQTQLSGEFRFAILGDRTGGAFPGAYQEAWREVDGDKPDFVMNVGDTIEGGDDSALIEEWKKIAAIIAPYRRYRFFYVPGNHDVWSEQSARMYVKQAGRPLHYSFDYAQAHFTVLDNSRTESLAPQEIAFLREDLETHATQPVKFVLFHRPSWILKVLLRDPEFPLHKLALQYGVKYVICGHLHEMLRFELDGVTYLSLASSGGHLRQPRTYEKGWFFQHTLVTVKGTNVRIEIKELAPPFGQSRVTMPEDWGPAGLNKARQ